MKFHFILPFLMLGNRYFLLFLLPLVFSSCSEKQHNDQAIDSDMKVIEAKGIAVPLTSLTPPKVVLLDSVPKPQKIEVPTKAGGSYISEGLEKGEKIDLLPPESKSAGVHYFIVNFTTEQGLAINTANCSTIDKKGNLWFGTFAGATKYDGKSFINYTTAQGLGFAICRSIHEDKLGNLWFGMDGGLSKYDGISFNTFTKEQGLAGDVIFAIVEDKIGNLWFGTEDGVSLYNGKSFQNFTMKDGLISKIVLSIVEDKKGNLWFGTDGGLSKYDGKSFVNYTTKQGLTNNYVTASLLDKTGNLWFCTQGGGVSKFDGTSFINYTISEGLASNDIYAILEDKNGNLWFGTDSGAIEYDGKSFVNYTMKEGLASNKVTSILEDNGRNLWFSTVLGGLSRYNGKFLTYYTTNQGLPNINIICLMEDKSKNLWIGTEDGGVCRYDGKSFTTYTINQGLISNQVYAIFEDKIGNIWFGTTGGLSKYDGKSFTNYTTTQGLAANIVNVIQQDNVGNLWIGTYGGMSKFDGKSFTNYTTEQGLPSNTITYLMIDSNENLWICTRDKGLSKFDGKSFTNYSVRQGLSHNSIFHILEDKARNLWISTHGGGLNRFDGNSFITYTTTQGLPDDTLYYVGLTKEEDLAIGTNAGLALLTGFSKLNVSGIISAQNNLKNEELKNYSPIFEIYNVKSGYPIEDMQNGQQGMVLDSHGRIWAGTGSNKIGLICLNFSALYKNKNAPNVFIQDVRIDNEKISWYDLGKNKIESQSPYVNGVAIPILPNTTEEAITFGKVLSEAQRNALRRRFGDIKFDGITKFYYIPENLQLPYKNNSISIDFEAIEPDFPQDVLYKSILEGYDKDWSSPKNYSKAIYGNLFEGIYTFKVKAKRTFSDWSDPITFQFKVLPPWYRTWWAYLGYIMSTLTAFYLIYLWRTAVLKKRYKELEVLYKATERFVPKSFLNLLKKEHIQDVKLGDCTEKVVTVLFTDIRGYTTLTEKLNPEQAYSFINGYLKHVAPIISSHQGFISQYQGDGIMALFPGQADDGMSAVLDMMEALIVFNAEQAKIHGHQIRVGYGLNTGPAMLGTIGVEERMDANVISDAINLASRVEGLNKFYGTTFLVSDATVNSLSNSKKYPMRLVDKVQVKGKEKAVHLYEVYSRKGVSEKEQAFIDTYEAAFKKYESGDLEGALAGFKQSHKMNPLDQPSSLLIERCEGLLKSGLPPDWDGTYAMTHK